MAYGSARTVERAGGEWSDDDDDGSPFRTGGDDDDDVGSGTAGGLSSLGPTPAVTAGAVRQDPPEREAPNPRVVTSST